MEPYEIIKEIRSGCSVNPLEQLNTLSNEVERLRNYYSESLDGTRCWFLIDLLDNLLQSTLTFSQFVPCDENGTPFLMEFELPNQARYNKIKQAYNKAQQNVIFEGWEVVSGKVIEHKETGCRVAFYSNGNVYFDRYTCSVSKGYLNYFLGTNPTLADLAAATIENPLKLK